MLPGRSVEPFDSPDWIYEVSWGGVRTLAFIRDGRVTLRGQNGVDLTESYPELSALASQLDGRSGVLDGEIVAMTHAGKPNLELLRPRLNQLLGGKEPRLPRAAVSYQVSDLLELDGQVLTGEPLWQRKNLLHLHFEPGDHAQVCDFVEGEGVLFFGAACEHGLHGVIAKRKDSSYHPGAHSDEWIEFPAVEVTNYVIGGYTFGGGARNQPFEALLLGLYRDGMLRYAGRATAGLATAEGWRTIRLLEGLHTGACPFTDPPTPTRFIYWCRPELACQVRIGERGPDGTPRFATFVALRPDVDPAECREG